MYIKKLILDNVGPISSSEYNLPFDNLGNPKPVVLVGQNGSGKSIALSFIVNALIHARQIVFEDAEIEKGKVYKYRSPAYIQAGQHYYLGQVILEDNFETTEWQLDTNRKEFEQRYQFTPARKSWASIPEALTNYFSSNFEDRQDKLRSLLGENCLLYFPPNRFEEPAWLNYDNLVAKAEFTKLKHVSGISNRQFIQYAPLSRIKNWILDVLFDRLNYELQTRVLPNQLNIPLPLHAGYQGPNSTLYNNILQVLRAVLRKEDSLRLGIGPRHRRDVALMRGTEQLLPSIFQLSTGETLLLNLAFSILRDFDLCRTQAYNLSEVRGAVIVDEVDLHLHVDFQHTILPQLLRMFPKVQFFLTSHSPLFLMGMQEAYGKDGFAILSMPEMVEIESERFAEFENVYKIYKESDAYARDLDKVVQEANKPVLFLEGTTDIRYITRASEILGEQNLINRVSLFDGDGFGNLDKVWKHFDTRLSTALARTVVLIYDCDKKCARADKGQLKRRVLAEIQGNPVKTGIENLFNRQTLERAIAVNPAYIDITPSVTKKVRGADFVVPETWAVNPDEKSNLCEWLCANGTADDFRNFQMLFDMLREAAL